MTSIWSTPRRQRHIVLIFTFVFGLLFTLNTIWGLLLWHWNANPHDAVHRFTLWLTGVVGLINFVVYVWVYVSKGRRR